MHVYARFRANSWSNRIGTVAVAMAMLALMTTAVACDPEESQSTAALPIATAVMPSPTPTQVPTATPEPTSTPEPTAMPAPTASSTPAPTATPAPELQTAREVLDAATAAVKGAHSGHIESEFTLEVEIEETKLVLSISVAGVFHTPDRAHLSVTYSIQGPPSVDIDGAKVDIGSQSWTEEWITVGDDVYVLSSLRGDSRHSRESIELPFDLSDIFRFDLLDSDGEISTNEQKLDGERVYYVTGPASPGQKIPAS